MNYKLFRVTGAAPPRNVGTLQEVGSVQGEFSATTFQGWNEFFGPEGWQPNNSFVFYTLSSLSTGDVIEVDSKRYKVTGGVKGRIRNTYFMVLNV